MSDQERFWPSATSRLLRVCPNQEEKVADQPYAGHRLGGAPAGIEPATPSLSGPTTVCGCSGWPSGSSWACTSTCGGSATASQAPTPTRPGFHRDQPTPWPAPLASTLSRRKAQPADRSGGVAEHDDGRVGLPDKCHEAAKAAGPAVVPSTGPAAPGAGEQPAEPDLHPLGHSEAGKLGALDLGASGCGQGRGWPVAGTAWGATVVPNRPSSRSVAGAPRLVRTPRLVRWPALRLEGRASLPRLHHRPAGDPDGQ
jgi:hypothetical protein